eukprot:GHVL01044167.1.p1 GENE.GHVL01044167.1~~GHVL01044167.1.p1  ORF type:complete len:188 (-),score=14.82 GHVL01044167.1:1015-1578(-)
MIKQRQLIKGLLMCALGGVFYCYEYFLRVAPSVMSPELMSAFSIKEKGYSQLLAYYYFAYVPLQLFVGIIIDFFQPRIVVTLACACCVLGNFLFANSDLLEIVKLGRFLVGFGSAFAYVGVLKIANAWLPKKYFAVVAGGCTTLGMLGAIMGSKFADQLLNTLYWKEMLNYSSIVGLILKIKKIGSN